MGDIYLKQLAVGPMKNFAYLVGAAGGKVCAVVDPGWDAGGLLAAARRDGRRITAVILTHNHFDHVGGLKKILQEGALPVYVHEEDAEDLAELAPDLRRVHDGACLDLGGLQAMALHTPGHTPGSQCLLAAGQLFTGDTLFLDCCGRIDLPGSDPAAMHKSLRRLAALPAQTMVWPGHDYGKSPSAALGDVLSINPCLAAPTLAQLLRLQG